MNDGELLLERDAGDRLRWLELKIPGAVQDLPLSVAGNVKGVLIRIFRRRKAVEIVQRSFRYSLGSPFCKVDKKNAKR